MIGRYLVLIIIGIFIYGKASYAVEDHLREALKYANAAVEDGKKGDSKGLTEHALMAKEQLLDVQKTNRSPQLDAAIQKLDMAIEGGKMGHTYVITEAAEGAVEHIKAVIEDRPGGCPEGPPCKKPKK